MSAVYNVAPYLEEFLQSIVTQTLPFEDNLQLILVDDGSTDSSPALIAKWQARYPTIEVLTKKNGGQASARNFGLKHAKGDWVTFIDPDDFLDRNYFAEIDDFLSTNVSRNVTLVCCKWRIYQEATKSFSDKHPLNYRFSAGSRIVVPEKTPSFMASSAATSFYRLDILRKFDLKFDEKIRPNFEDGHFSGRYLLCTTDTSVAYVATAFYLYRKRAAGTSTLDTSWQDERRFSVVVERGYLALMLEGLRRHQTVPTAVQRLVLYDLFWYFKRIVEDDASVAFLSDQKKQQFFRLVTQVFEHIDPATVMDFNAAGCWFFHKVGMLGCLKNAAPHFQVAYVRDYDRVKQLVCVSVFTACETPLISTRLDDVDVLPHFTKTKTNRLLGHTFANEHFAWVKVASPFARLTVKVNGTTARIALQGKQYPEGIICGSFIERLGRSTTPLKTSSLGAQVLKSLAERKSIRNEFNGAWMLMDRDSQADDNAEQLYHYLLECRPDITAYFVLRTSSHDWTRLKKSGFKLVAYGSFRHKMLLLNARHVISSHPDAFVLKFLDPKRYSEKLNFSFTFLQHGVIRDDISRWLNTKDIDLFVTSSPREYESVAGAVSTYKFSARETKLLGLARHDVLLTRTEPEEKVILIMPTWREALVGKTTTDSTQRGSKDTFFTSTYALAWRELIHSAQLKELAEKHSYKVVFFPHANMQVYLDWFDAPDWVEMRSHKTDPVLQKLFRRSRIMITDYSSVFFEFALLEKAVLHYQFDFEEMFSGTHTSRVGYFDFERDGFGPVARDEGTLVEELSRLLDNDGRASPQYRARMKDAFAHRDARNRERTVEAILDLESPNIPAIPDAVRIQAAREASQHKCWGLALERWEHLLESGDMCVREEARLQTARISDEIAKEIAMTDWESALS